MRAEERSPRSPAGEWNEGGVEMRSRILDNVERESTGGGLEELEDLELAASPRSVDSLGAIEGGRRIWWGLCFCNLAALWAYQTLITAQDIYRKRFPQADVAFWGTVVLGISLVITHLVQLLLSFEQHFTYAGRVVFGFGVTSLVGLLVVFIQQPWLIL
eukprot:Hpha_TRINITY_DN15672_c0_g4::TRINITY_DN15672_c0_g4_i1::g.101841::m.101841